jgi:hypothetical protein
MDIREHIVDREADGGIIEGGTYPAEDEGITSLATLQFHTGGLFDARPVDDLLVHLVRSRENGGTPGPTLCGIRRFAPESAGWSVRGGITPKGHVFVACEGCARSRAENFPTLSVSGLGSEAHGE